MEIVFLKTGKFSIHPARGPVIDCRTGEKCSVQDTYAEVLIEHGMARNAIAPMARVKMDKPWLSEDFDPKARGAKDKLIAYASCVFGIKFDTRKRIKTIIRELEGLEQDG